MTRERTATSKNQVPIKLRRSKVASWLRYLVARFRRNSYFVAFGLLTLVALIVSGLAPFDASTTVLALFAFASPIYVWLSFKSQFNSQLKSETLAVFFSLVLSSVVLALLFGFTPLSAHQGIFWICAAACITFAIFLEFTIRSASERLPRNGQDLIGLISTAVMLILGSVYLKSTHPYAPLDPKWVPDDYPFFAIVGKDSSLGAPGEAFFNNLEFNYHWLTYSLFGGLNRLAGTDFILGTLRIAPVVSWLLLCLGAILLVQIFSTRRVTVVLAVSSVMFSGALGALIFSVPSLGGLFISPSTLITAAWMVALLIFVNHITKAGDTPVFLVPLLAVIGFTMALGKITTAVASLLGLAAIAGFNSIKSQANGSARRQFLRAQTVVSLPFAVGVVVESRLFLRNTETPLTIEGRLLPEQIFDPMSYSVNLIPVFAALFAVAVMVLPTLLAFSRNRKDALFFATAIISTIGLILIFVLELPAGNEAWFLVAVLALALPLSSVVVVDSMYTVMATEDRFRSMKIIFTLASLGLLTTGLLLLGNEAFFITRAWVIPAILVTLGCGFALMWQITDIASLRRLQAKPVISLAAAFLFLASLTYGFALRTESAIASSIDRGQASLSRDAWLKASQVQALKVKNEVRSSPIAIYSDSPGELALTRWIPYFLDTQAYTLGSLDELTDFYSPNEEIQKRREWVSSYVMSADLKACRELSSDGVQFIWITQGFDNSSGESTTNLKPSVIPVLCD